MSQGYFSRKSESITRDVYSAKPSVGGGVLVKTSVIAKTLMEGDRGGLIMPTLMGLSPLEADRVLQDMATKDGVTLITNGPIPTKDPAVSVNPKVTELGYDSGKLVNLDFPEDSAVLADVNYAGANLQIPTVIGVSSRAVEGVIDSAYDGTPPEINVETGNVGDPSVENSPRHISEGKNYMGANNTTGTDNRPKHEPGSLEKASKFVGGLSKYMYWIRF